MCYGKKFQQNRPNRFGGIMLFDFQDGRRPPSWILKFLNIWSSVRLGWLICFVVPSLSELVTDAEISHVTIFKMAAVRHLGFLKIGFSEQSLGFGGPIC